MSAEIDTALQEERKSLDKKEIEDEEREKMLNIENKAIDEAQKIESDATDVIKSTVEPVTEEGREVKPKFIPIGGIKMPGFFTRSKSKEKCKDGDDGAQGELLEKPPTEEVVAKENVEEKEVDTQKKSRFQSLKIRNPFSKKSEDNKDPDVNNSEETGQKRGLLNAIRLPLVNMIPRKLRGHSGGKDAEAGLDAAKTAELASMETLDDNKDAEKLEIKTDDGMETVKLDVEDKTDGNTDFNKEKLNWRERIRQQKFIIDDLAIAAGVLLFIILLIIIIAVTASGGAIVASPLKNGRYVDAVTSCGYVEGILEDGAFAFRGIPYALPPTEENRWKPAQPLNRLESCWNGTLKAHNATPSCLQIYGNGTNDGVEDCLTLDVITPHVRYDTPLPVIVLIGSESLIGGMPGKLRPSTRYARSKDVLFVRPNFRVGILGFLSSSTLSKSSPSLTSGNYGLSDIIVALEWVQLNIKHFGGDPKAVTLFGHRAGATLVTALLGYEKADKLFTRVWVSSGSGVYPGKPIQEYEEANNAYLDLIKCKDANCLRSSKIDDIMTSVPDTWRSAAPDLPAVDEEPNKNHEWLTLDGFLLKTHLMSVLPNTKIPVVIGTTAHESASNKLLMRYSNWTTELVTKHINGSQIGKAGIVDEVIKRYNATYQGLAAMITDIRTVCPLSLLAKQRAGIAFYVVTQTSGENNIADVDSDISAILGRYEPKTPEQRRYVAAMQQLFYHYVWHGEVVQANTRNNNQVLDVGQDVLSVREYPNCDFWISKDFVPRYAHQD